MKQVLYSGGSSRFLIGCVLFQNEAMTGTYTQNPVISRITLALMEDTGLVLSLTLYIPMGSSS